LNKNIFHAAQLTPALLLLPSVWENVLHTQIGICSHPASELNLAAAFWSDFT